MSPVSRCISPTACIINKNNKSFTRFFSCRDLPPPVCLRFSPGLFRHGGGAASCHTYSMAANPHLALTKNSSTSTLANGRCAVQIAVSKGSASGRPAHGAKHPRRARRELPHRPKAPSADGAIPAAMPQGRRPHPKAGGGRRPFRIPVTINQTILQWPQSPASGHAPHCFPNVHKSSLVFFPRTL